MAIPKTFLISREEDYHTHYIGVYENGNQFFAYDHFIGDSNNGSFTVVYIFDSSGNFIDHKYWHKDLPPIYGTDGEEISENMIRSFGDYEFADEIIVTPFEIEIEGHIFGLIPDEDSSVINLMPNMTIAFYSPWDGRYDT